MIYKLSKLVAVLPLLILTGCAALIPEMSNIIDSIEDTAVCVEVNEDAMRDDTDIIINVQVINKDPPKATIAKQ